MKETSLKQKIASIDDWETGVGALVKEKISVENFFGIEPIKKDKVVLDLGCGMGYHLDTFKCTKVGLDASKVNLIEAKKVSPSSLFVLGDANKLPFRDGVFDLIYSIEVFHHLTIYDLNTRVIDEISRTLKQNGMFMVEDANSEGLIFILPLVAFVMALTRLIGHHSEGFGMQIKKTLQYLNRLGFNVIKAETKASFFKWFLFRPERLNPFYPFKKVIIKLDDIFRRKLPPQYLMWYKFVAIKNNEPNPKIIISRGVW